MAIKKIKINDLDGKINEKAIKRKFNRVTFISLPTMISNKGSVKYGCKAKSNLGMGENQVSTNKNKQTRIPSITDKFKNKLIFI